MTDTRSSTALRGELHELRTELLESSKDGKNETIKKIISAMAMGKDVSSLFPDIVNCMQTDNIELKKLVYLYVNNYAKVQPELAILAVNTFCRDSMDRNPLIRALAIRTMGSIHLAAITEYLIEPLKRCVKDSDSYVRKTAVMCISKLYDIAPTLAVEEGFIDMLKEMLFDTNSMVVSNAVAAIVEISSISHIDYFSEVLDRDRSFIDRLLSALNDCMEWGQICILDALSLYKPKNKHAAQELAEKVLPRLSHANPAVVLSSIKVILKMIRYINDKKVTSTLEKKLIPSLITMVYTEPEIQYVALRNINIIVQKYPSLLVGHIKIFFCKYNDPIYLKMEKVEIIEKLVTVDNFNDVFVELKEYASEIDVEFVRRSIRAIGNVAILLDQSLKACLTLLEDLLKTGVSHVVEEAVIVVRNIFHHYPGSFNLNLFKLCTLLDFSGSADAKSALIWIIGEYDKKIDNAADYLSFFIENYNQELPNVQLSLLTACVKIYLSSPKNDNVKSMFKLIENLLESNNPDVRDRAQIYYRMITINPELSKKIVCSPKPKIVQPFKSSEVLDVLIDNLSMVSSVVHIPPLAIMSKNVKASINTAVESSSSYSDDSGNANVVDDDDDSDSTESKSDSEVDFFQRSSYKHGKFTQAYSLVFGLSQSGSQGTRGLEIYAKFSTDPLNLDLQVVNKTVVCGVPTDITFEAIQFNKNPFGIGPISGAINPVVQIPPGQTKTFQVSLKPNIGHLQSGSEPKMPLVFQMAIKANIDIYYFSVNLPLNIAFVKHLSPADKNNYKKNYKSPDLKSMSFTGVSMDCDAQKLLQTLVNHGIEIVFKKSTSCYGLAQTCTGVYIYLKVQISNTNNPSKYNFAVKSTSNSLNECFKHLLIDALNLKT